MWHRHTKSGKPESPSDPFAWRADPLPGKSSDMDIADTDMEICDE